MVSKYIFSFLKYNNLLSAFQHGFIKGKSAELHRLSSLKYWNASIDDSKSVDIVYLNFRKPFYKVSHEHIGISGKHQCEISDCLTDKIHSVKLCSSYSPISNIISGLFLLMEYDMSRYCTRKS